MPPSLLKSNTDLQSVPTVFVRNDSVAYFMEAELLGAIMPRVARRTKENIVRTRFLWNALFVAIGLVGFLWRRDYDTWNALIARGISTQATVYSKRTRTGKSTTYYLDYQFKTRAETVVDTTQVSSAVYAQYNEGDGMTVTYLPEERVTKWQLGEVSAQRRDEQSWRWFWGGVGVTALLGAIIGGINVNTKKQLGLLQNGKATRGRVVSGEVIRGKYTTWRLHYSYETSEGARTGTVDVTADQYRERTEENPFMTVLYDPVFLGWSMPYFKITEARLVAAFSS